jgi:hypothetical protein
MKTEKICWWWLLVKGFTLKNLCMKAVFYLMIILEKETFTSEMNSNKNPSEKQKQIIFSPNSSHHHPQFLEILQTKK